jgi:hypothetical protein
MGHTEIVDGWNGQKNAEQQVIAGAERRVVNLGGQYFPLTNRI